MHRLPGVKEIEFTFIGPALMEEEENQPSVPSCQTCQTSGKSVSYSVFPIRYSQFKKLDSFHNPDLVLVQNSGFSEFQDRAGVPGWEEGWSDLKELVPEYPSLLVFTAYTRGEAEKDLARFIKYSDADLLVSCSENPMRSWRPCRDWENDDNQDVFYCNQYLSVARNKKTN